MFGPPPNVWELIYNCPPYFPVHVRQYADTMVSMDGDEGDMAGYTFGASGFGDTIRGNLP